MTTPGACSPNLRRTPSTRACPTRGCACARRSARRATARAGSPVLTRLAALNTVDTADAGLREQLERERANETDADTKLALETAALDTLLMHPDRLAERIERLAAATTATATDPLQTRVGARAPRVARDRSRRAGGRRMRDAGGRVARGRPAAGRGAAGARRPTSRSARSCGPTASTTRSGRSMPCARTRSPAVPCACAPAPRGTRPTWRCATAASPRPRPRRGSCSTSSART